MTTAYEGKREHYRPASVKSDLVTNTTRRLPVVLCLDVSPSMSLHNRIEDLNRAIQSFYQELHEELKALAAVEVDIITFSSKIVLHTGFETIETLRDRTFTPVTDDWTNLPLAVNTAIQAIDDRLAEYRDKNIKDPYLPFLVLVTDGDPDATSDPRELRQAVEAVQSRCVLSSDQNLHLIAPYIIGVGEEVKKESLDPFAERFTREAILINEKDADLQSRLFQQMFSLIGASVRNSLRGESDLGRLYERLRRETMRQTSDLIHRVRGVL